MTKRSIFTRKRSLYCQCPSIFAAALGDIYSKIGKPELEEATI